MRSEQKLVWAWTALWLSVAAYLAVTGDIVPAFLRGLGVIQ